MQIDAGIKEEQIGTLFVSVGPVVGLWGVGGGSEGANPEFRHGVLFFIWLLLEAEFKA
jgi:hypothetical protein